MLIYKKTIHRKLLYDGVAARHLAIHGKPRRDPYLNTMQRITIDKKKYVLMPEKDYEALLVKAVRKTKPVKKLSLAEGKKLAHDWIENRAKEK